MPGPIRSALRASARSAVRNCDAKRSSAPSSPGWRKTSPNSVMRRTVPAASSARIAARGSDTSAGSAIARTVRNGMSCSCATAATAALSMSAATAPVRVARARLCAAVATGRSVVSRVAAQTSPAPSSACLACRCQASDTSQRRACVSTISAGKHTSPGLRAGDSAAAQPQLTRPRAPRSISWCAARAALSRPTPATQTRRASPSAKQSPRRVPRDVKLRHSSGKATMRPATAAFTRSRCALCGSAPVPRAGNTCCSRGTSNRRHAGTPAP